MSPRVDDEVDDKVDDEVDDKDMRTNACEREISPLSRWIKFQSKEESGPQINKCVSMTLWKALIGKKKNKCVCYL